MCQIEHTFFFGESVVILTKVIVSRLGSMYPLGRSSETRVIQCRGSVFGNEYCPVATYSPYFSLSLPCFCPNSEAKAKRKSVQVLVRWEVATQH